MLRSGIDFQTYGAVVHFENRSSALKMEAAVAISAGSFQLRGAKLMACTVRQHSAIFVRAANKRTNA